MVVARLGVNDTQFYSSPKCSVLEDAGNDLYSNFVVREEYDPINFPRKDCLLYLVSTCFTQSLVPMTILLIAEVTPSLSSKCNQGPVSSKAAFTIQFFEAGETDPACPVNAEIEEPTSFKPPSKPPDYVALIILAVGIALVLILIIILGCCWWNGCFWSGSE